MERSLTILAFLFTWSGCTQEGTEGVLRCPRDGLSLETEQPELWRVCHAARVFAARDAVGLVPTQTEVDLYFERWSRVVEAEPLLRDARPWTYRNPTPYRIEVETSVPNIVSAWRSGELETGNLAIDATLGELYQPEVIYIDQLFDTETYGAIIGVAGIYNEDALQVRLAHGGVHLAPPTLVTPRDDGEWMWVGPEASDAHIEFDFGWGDCLAGCSHFRKLIAFVRPTGAAEVFDAGGDPLPEGVHLSPTTRPYRP